MSTAIAATASLGSKIERVLVQGDLSALTADERVVYVNKVCTSLGLNPLTRPFDYITLNGKLTLYAKKDCTDQLRKLHGVSVIDLTSQCNADIYVVTCKLQDRGGRTDCATGAVAIGQLKGEALANALMKAETKSKRRGTLSICGLGILDETEVETIEAAAPAPPAPRPAAGPVITRDQQKLLFAKADELGLTRETFKAWLADRGFTGTSAIPRDRFDAVLGDLQALAGAAGPDEDERP